MKIFNTNIYVIMMHFTENFGTDFDWKHFSGGWSSSIILWHLKIRKYLCENYCIDILKKR